VEKYVKGGEFNNGIYTGAVIEAFLYIEEISVGSWYANDKSHGKGF